jgi:hypothetical protein
MRGGERGECMDIGSGMFVKNLGSPGWGSV